MFINTVLELKLTCFHALTADAQTGTSLCTSADCVRHVLAGVDTWKRLDVLPFASTAARYRHR